MSLHYIIDGYNVIKHPSFNISQGIKDIRVALAEFIRTRRLCGSPRNKIIIVFDGNPNVSGRSKNKGDINIIFTKAETADEWIKRAVESEANPKNTIVVSDDKEIKFFVNSTGARTLSVEEFINCKEKLKEKQKKGLLKPELTYSQIHQINQELKKIWLK